MRVVVIGGGIVGIASAYRLAASGVEVVLIEADRPGAGATHGNAAKIALAESAPVPAPGVLLQGLRWMLKPDSPLSIRPSLDPGYLRFLLSMARHCNGTDFRRGLELHLHLAQSANELLDSYVDDGLEYEMHTRGVLLAFETEQRYREHGAQLETYAQFGFEPEHLTGDRIFEVEPALSDRITHGLFFPGDRQLQPDSLSEALVNSSRDRGVDVRSHTTVTGFRSTGERVTGVRLSDGSDESDGEELETDAVVLAAGAWTRSLAASLGVDLPIFPGKGYSLDYSPAPVELRTSLTLEDARVAVTPLEGTVRLAGTMEFGARDLEIDDVRVAAIRRAAHKSLRGWSEAQPDTREATPWAGVRPMTPDGLPIVGRIPDLANVYAASGHGMLGLTLAPGTADLISHEILGTRSETPQWVLDAVSPGRFGRGLPNLRRPWKRSASLAAPRS